MKKKEGIVENTNSSRPHEIFDPNRTEPKSLFTLILLLALLNEG